jgi:hypothetical protein
MGNRNGALSQRDFTRHTDIDKSAFRRRMTAEM